MVSLYLQTIIKELSKAIEEKGYEYLKIEPMMVYKSLLKKNVPLSSANAILYFLVSDIEKGSKNIEELTEEIELKTNYV